jgi:hypothetical protein
LIPYNRYISKNVYVKSNRKKQKMAITLPTVGSQFTTQRAGIVGVVQEIVMNKSGSARVRLDVNGETRWTTVK